MLHNMLWERLDVNCMPCGIWDHCLVAYCLNCIKHLFYQFLTIVMWYGYLRLQCFQNVWSIWKFRSVQFAISSGAACSKFATPTCGNSSISRRPTWTSPFASDGGTCWISVEESSLLTSSGSILDIGRFVHPFAVAISTAIVTPSKPVINFSTTASSQCIFGTSLLMITTSPNCTCCLVFPKVLWYSRREVRYSFFHLDSKCLVNWPWLWPFPFLGVPQRWDHLFHHQWSCMT